MIISMNAEKLWHTKNSAPISDKNNEESRKWLILS